MDERLYTKALKYLSRRPRSSKEVHDNLFKPFIGRNVPVEQKQIAEQAIQEVIAKLVTQRFLHDHDFALWWIDQRTRFKAKGWHAIELELRQKGIAQDIIKELAVENKNQQLENRDEKALARALVEKRMHRYVGLSKDELYRKLGGLLARRGFDMDIIRGCIDEVLRK